MANAIIRRKKDSKEKGRNILESAENYLETIFILSRDGGKVRAIDIAGQLEFSKPSVSVALKNLKSQGFVASDKSGFITLTKSGLKIAKEIYERHIVISEWLVSLGVSEETAIKDACKMEHILSEKSFLAIKAFIEKSEKV